MRSPRSFRDERAFRLASGGRIDRARPISFTFDGKTYQRLCRRHARLRVSPTASISSAARTNIIGRAGSSRRRRGGAERACRPARGRRALHARICARPQIPLNEGLVADEPEPLAVAAVRRRRDQRPALAAVFGAGFYYKTFMGPNWFGKNWAWKHLYEPFDPPRRRPRRRAARARSRRLRAIFRPLRRADRRRGPGRAGRGEGRGRKRRATSSFATSRRSRAARCSPRRARRSTASARADWLAATLDALRGDRMCG